MLFNAQKCKVMHIGKNNTQHEYFMNDQDKIHTVEVEKYLVVIISKDMKVSSHCSYAYNKANRMFGLIK